MEKINRFNIVRIHLAGAPIDGLEGTVLDEEPRADGLHYFVDVKGEDCTWILPENALEPIGQVENRHRGWDGATLVPWDVN